MTDWVQLKLQVLAIGAPACAVPAMVVLAFSRKWHHAARCPGERLTAFPTFCLYGPAVLFGALWGGIYAGAAVFCMPAGWGSMIWLLLALGLAIPWALVTAATWLRWMDRDPHIHSPARLTLAFYSCAAFCAFCSAEALQFYS